MGYIEKNLVPGETVVYKTRLHWIVMIWLLLEGVLLGAIGLAMCIGGYVEKGAPAGWIVAGLLCLVVAGALIAAGMIRRRATEIAVSNKRVLIKRGLVSQRSIEVLLPKVESISVNESAFGRMLGYGDVILRGTGGTFETFTRIAHPDEFRRQVQQQTGAAETR
ncbi:MAG: PH domain-containing protein [Candidatus Acidiferrales bacterium]